MTPLPVSVVRHVTGREQVVAAADPDRPYTPDEITGDVPVPTVRTPATVNESDDPTGEAASMREPGNEYPDSAHITPAQLADDRILSRAPRVARTADVDPNESVDLSDFLEE